ncbi:MAG: glycogen synthase GlgA, partial [Candidatus Aminicenantales bacterium]
STLGVDVKLFLPFYREIKRKNLHFKKILPGQRMDWNGKMEDFSLWEANADSFSVYFIEKDEYYDRDYLYASPQGDYPDNGERFAFFSKASLVSLKALNFKPHILHGHDWQTAPALAYLKFLYKGDPFFQNIRSLFTIHNLAYQGLFKRDVLSRIGLPDSLFNMEDLEFYGKVNFLKAGILYATAVSTVSPRYSQEIQTPEYGHGLDGLLRKRKDALSGILNGVDYSAWNPSSDGFLVSSFGPDDFRGKKECKRDLLHTFHLRRTRKNIPVLGMVSRLAGQKGLDLLCNALESLFRTDVFLIILGTGEENIQNVLKAAQEQHPSRFGLHIAFDEALAHKITAGSDLFLIPSRYEPCGLTQMYSLKYGTIPVVRATGGLEDTIQEFNPETKTGNGFKFQEYTAEAFLKSLEKALQIYPQKNLWRRLIQNAMASDFSWERSAQDYLRLYETLVQSPF